MNRTLWPSAGSARLRDDRDPDIDDFDDDDDDDDDDDGWDDDDDDDEEADDLDSALDF